MSDVLVVGAGGHGKVVADILIHQGETVVGFIDDDERIQGQYRLKLPILGPLTTLEKFGNCMLAPGIGSNAVRKAVVERIGAVDSRWISAVHPSAIIAPSVSLGRGIVVAAGAVINVDAAIGDFAIINTSATIDHDCHIDSYCHVAPGANLAGGVQVGQGTLVGIGACVIPYRSIGQWAVIGAGAAVTMDIPDHVTAVGVPASWKST